MLIKNNFDMNIFSFRIFYKIQKEDFYFKIRCLL